MCRTIIGAAGLTLALLVAGISGVAAQPQEQVADVNHRNADGSTPLQWAVYAGDLAEAKRLLDAGADLTLANDYGATAMSLAAEVAHTRNTETAA